MSAFTVIGTSRLGVEPSCTACGAGASVSFNWAYARKRGASEDKERIALFALWRPLRRGQLHRCRMCQAIWHLDGDAQDMTHVENERLDLVLAWDREPIGVPPDIVAIAEKIGPTPPDVYGNGHERRVTPCAITTVSGTTFETALICVQLDAPVQAHMQFRLGSEIASIRESPFALPAEVRRASSRAEEMRMGFSPTLIEMLDGRRFVMNGMTSFMVVDGYDASEARVVTGSFFREDPSPAFVEKPKDPVYFIVDGDPGWVVNEPGAPPLS